MVSAGAVAELLRKKQRGLARGQLLRDRGVKAVSVPLTPWKAQVLGAALQLVLLPLQRWQLSLAVCLLVRDGVPTPWRCLLGERLALLLLLLLCLKERVVLH